MNTTYNTRFLSDRVMGTCVLGGCMFARGKGKNIYLDGKISLIDKYAAKALKNERTLNTLSTSTPFSFPY